MFMVCNAPEFSCSLSIEVQNIRGWRYLCCVFRLTLKDEGRSFKRILPTESYNACAQLFDEMSERKMPLRNYEKALNEL